MDELNKAYEAFEMLKALDLPVTKDFLDNIEILEKESGMKGREDLRLYFYEKCFEKYKKRIKNIRQAKIRGEVIVAKPVLLLTLIEGINENVFKENDFRLNEWIEGRYVLLMKKYTTKSSFSNIAGLENPYWHLTSDGFWFLETCQDHINASSPSKRWLKDNVTKAYFEDELWLLLKNEVWRKRIYEYIIDEKLSDS